MPLFFCVLLCKQLENSYWFCPCVLSVWIAVPATVLFKYILHILPNTSDTRLLCFSSSKWKSYILSSWLVVFYCRTLRVYFVFWLSTVIIWLSLKLRICKQRTRFSCRKNAKRLFLMPYIHSVEGVYSCSVNILARTTPWIITGYFTHPHSHQTCKTLHKIELQTKKLWLTRSTNMWPPSAHIKIITIV